MHVPCIQVAHNHACRSTGSGSAVHMIGKIGSCSLANEDVVNINELLITSGLTPIKCKHVCRVSYKAKINGTTFVARQNQRVQRRNSYTASFFVPSKKSLSYGFIEKFIAVNNHEVALVQELSVVSRGPQTKVPESIATATSQALLFENYLTYKEESTRYIFTHQIRDLCCNLANCGWKLLTTVVNNIEVE